MCSRPVVTLQVENDGRLDVEVLDAWSEESFVLTRSQLRRLIDLSLVACNGVKVHKSGHRVRAGDIITISPEPEGPSVVPPSVEVVYQDDTILVVNKPPGLTVHAGASTTKGATLVDAVHVRGIRLAGGPTDRPGVVHRLDNQTSGLLVLALSQEAYDGLVKQFAQRVVEKTYLALVMETARRRSVFGQEDKGEVNAPLGRDPYNRTKRTVRTDGKEAITRWEVVERFEEAVLVRLYPRTGRTHQIRVHCAHEKAPLFADVTYRRTDMITDTVSRVEAALGRHALHASSLSFSHPVSRQTVSFSAPLPDDFQAAIALLRQ